MLQFNELSKIGFGGYRFSGEEEQLKALMLSLDKGCNVIDTSTNYKRGKSEEAFGACLTDRHNVFIISKAGYVYDNNVLHSLSRGALNELVKLSDGSFHCIHPEYLNIQLDLSLLRLKRRSIDAYLIHNPEYFFNQNIPVDKEAFYARIRQAFCFLEDAVSQGKIRYYGISSNNFPLSPLHPKAVDLRRLVDIAEEVSIHNHFKIIQFPFNVVENSALDLHYNELSLIALAKRKGIHTVSNRPFNAHQAGSLMRIATYPVPANLDVERDDKDFRLFVRKLNDYMLSVSSEYESIEMFPLVSSLLINWMNLRIDTIDNVFEYNFLSFISTLYDDEVPSDVHDTWLYFKNKATAYARKNVNEQALKIFDEAKQESVSTFVPGESIARTACKYYIESGVDTVLVGMTKVPYVNDLCPLF